MSEPQVVASKPSAQTRPTQSESDPTGRSSHTPGAKLDAGKVPILQGALEYFPNALREVAQVSYKGSLKYTWKGWMDVPDGINRYGNALARHLLATDLYDEDTGCLHSAQVAWNALARLELILREQKEKAKSHCGMPALFGALIERGISELDPEC